MGRSGDALALPSWGFADPGPLRDELTALALAGTKTTTASLRVEFELDGEAVPVPGDLSMLVDSAGVPVALVETLACPIIRLADVDDRHAIDEGEGYADAAEFRVAHERYWNGYLGTLRERLGDPSFALSDDTEIAAERFRIVEILGPDGRRLEPRVRPAQPSDRPAVDAFLAEHNADVVARLGALVDARGHPALVVDGDDGALDGVLTWILASTSLEVLTLHAGHQWRGTGTALIAAARRVAEAVGARRLWLITTNDNVDGLRFYQRRGFRLAQLRRGAVDRARTTLKPGIPELGLQGIPIRDELELEFEVRGGGAGSSVADELAALEVALARRDEASIPGGFEAVIAADFAEIGASGRLWTRDETMGMLDVDAPNSAVHLEDVAISELAPDLVLMTYDAVGSRPDGTTLRRRRSSIWVRRDGRWQMRFNQGTPIPPNDATTG